jgi:heme-degrading monooxygenase HmoA
MRVVVRLPSLQRAAKLVAAAGRRRCGGALMFIAMNRFKVERGSEADFEKVWTSRDSHLSGVPGFSAFHLLRGPERDDHVLYSSHTIWRSKADFEAWTRSEAFRLAHQDAGQNRRLYLGHPEFEGFDVIQTIEPG